MRNFKLLKDGSIPEWVEQEKVANYLRYLYPDILWTATASGLRTSYSQANKMKRMGLNRGCPDILIFEPRKGYYGLAIEMKSKHGTPTKEQKEWIEKLNKNFWQAVICYSSDEAINIIEDYLGKSE